MFTDVITYVNDMIVNTCQLLAMVVIFIGIVKALLIYIKDVLFNKKAIEAIAESRLEIGHSFSLGLSFLIGASILKTIIAPTWNDIGQLAAIIGIRTALNYFLLKDVENLSAEMGAAKKTDPAA
jgi:Predicted membrane protein